VLASKLFKIVLTCIEVGEKIEKSLFNFKISKYSSTFCHYHVVTHKEKQEWKKMCKMRKRERECVCVCVCVCV
jgi:hypothetical protein